MTEALQSASTMPILMYHSVDSVVSADYAEYAVPPDLFRRHMDALIGFGYRPMSLSDLLDEAAQGKPLARVVAVTFDDGLRDFLVGAMPIIQELGIGATLYVTTGYVGATSRWLAPLGEGRRSMLSWPEVREVAASGVEIGAHSVTHPQLDILPRGIADQEIRISKARLEEQISKPVTSFAYPHGYASRTTRRLVSAAGFRSACRVRHALSSPTEDRYGLSRIIVTPDLDENDLVRLVSGRSLPVAPPQERLVQTLWRVTRRLKRSRPDAGVSQPPQPSVPSRNGPAS